MLNALSYYILQFSKYLNKNYVYGDSFQNLRTWSDFTLETFVRQPRTFYGVYKIAQKII